MSCRTNPLALLGDRVHNMSMFKNVLFTAGLAAIVAPAFAGVEWMTDLEAAKSKAAAENKAVLVDFTGSDWCGWCIKLKKEVFDTPAFEQYVADKFVLVEVDVPQNAAKVGGEEQLLKNQELCEQYGVEGFPTILVLTPAGQVAGGFSGGADMQKVTSRLDAALANVKLLSEAAALQGVEKAKALLKVYDSMPAGIADAEALRDEIAALAPENETGIHDELNVEKQREELIEKLQPVLDTDYAAALSIIDEAIATALPGNLEYFQALKLEVIQTNIIMDLGKVQTVEEVEAIKQRFLNEFVPLLPEEVQAEVKTQIEQEFADPAEVLKRIQASQQEQAEPQVQAPDLTEEEQAILLALQQKLQDCGQDVDAMLVIIDEALTTATPAQQQYLTPVKMMILMQKSQALLMAAETVEDIEAARVVSMQAVELLPEADKEEATRMMQETFADPEGLLQTLRLMREAQTPAAE